MRTQTTPGDDRGAPRRRPRPADRKQQLVARAATLFLQRGYPMVSVADIAAATGVTAPSVYRHFADKQALLAAAVLSGVDGLEECTTRALGTTGSNEDLVTAICKLGVRRPESVSLWRWNSVYLSDDQNKQVAVRTREVLERWAAVLVDSRPALAAWESRQLAWAALSVAGSLSLHHTRVPSTQVRDQLEVLVRKLIRLTPSQAAELTPVMPLTDPSPTRRDQILDAAAGLFAQRGYADVGVGEIGAAVGITGPSVYKHFPSKLSVLVGIGARSATRLDAAALAAQATTADPAKLLALLVDSYVATITSTPDLVVAFNSSGFLVGKPGGAELIGMQRRYVARWVDLLRQVDPDLTHSQGSVAVHAALSIVNDSVRIGRGVTRPEFPSQMAFLMKGILGLS